VAYIPRYTDEYEPGKGFVSRKQTKTIPKIPRYTEEYKPGMFVDYRLLDKEPEENKLLEELYAEDKKKKEKAASPATKRLSSFLSRLREPYKKGTNYMQEALTEPKDWKQRELAHIATLPAALLKSTVPAQGIQGIADLIEAVKARKDKKKLEEIKTRRIEQAAALPKSLYKSVENVFAVEPIIREYKKQQAEGKTKGITPPPSFLSKVGWGKAVPTQWKERPISAPLEDIITTLSLVSGAETLASKFRPTIQTLDYSGPIWREGFTEELITPTPWKVKIDNFLNLKKGEIGEYLWEKRGIPTAWHVKYPIRRSGIDRIEIIHFIQKEVFREITGLTPTSKNLGQVVRQYPEIGKVLNKVGKDVSLAVSRGKAPVPPILYSFPPSPYSMEVLAAKKLAAKKLAAVLQKPVVPPAIDVEKLAAGLQKPVVSPILYSAERVAPVLQKTAAPSSLYSVEKLAAGLQKPVVSPILYSAERVAPVLQKTAVSPSLSFEEKLARVLQKPVVPPSLSFEEKLARVLQKPVVPPSPSFEERVARVLQKPVVPPAIDVEKLAAGLQKPVVKPVVPPSLYSAKRLARVLQKPVVPPAIDVEKLARVLQKPVVKPVVPPSLYSAKRLAPVLQKPVVPPVIDVEKLAAGLQKPVTPEAALAEVLLKRRAAVKPAITKAEKINIKPVKNYKGGLDRISFVVSDTLNNFPAKNIKNQTWVTHGGAAWTKGGYISDEGHSARLVTPKGAYTYDQVNGLRKDDSPAFQWKPIVKVAKDTVAGKNTFMTKEQATSFLETQAAKEKITLKDITPKKEIDISELTTLRSGIDIGVGKYVEEDIKPKIEKAKETAGKIKTLTKGIKDLGINIIQPSALVRELDKEAFPDIYRGTVGKTERAVHEYRNTKIAAASDATINELSKTIAKYPETIQEQLSLIRGNPSTKEGKAIKLEAYNSLPKELKTPALQKALQEQADINLKLLQELYPTVEGVADYFYGKYNNKSAVDNFIKGYYGTTTGYIKKKIYPTAADAAAAGLKLREKNPFENLAAEHRAIAARKNMVWLKDKTLKYGDDVIIKTHRSIKTKTGWITKSTGRKAPEGWVKVNDSVFNDYMVEPNYAKLINNLISTNKVTQIPAANTFRRINNVSREILYALPVFHLRAIVNLAIADATIYEHIMGKPIKNIFSVKPKTWEKMKKEHPLYPTYIENGGERLYFGSIEKEAEQALGQVIDKLARGNILGGLEKIGGLPIKSIHKFQKWTFETYIPMMKFSKFAENYYRMEKHLGRKLKPSEIQEIVKEQQNLYGMVNESLFGRSATAISLARFPFLSPAFAEGNIRTMLKAISQWGSYEKGGILGEGGVIRGGAGRSRRAMLNSMLLIGVLATIGTIILTGKKPKTPKTPQDIEDLFKVDTGQVDKNGKRILIDIGTAEKDYWRIFGNILTGRPIKAASAMADRLGGMLNPAFQMGVDVLIISMGKNIYDYKEDKVVELHDSFAIKLGKIISYEASRFKPIPIGVYQQSRAKDLAPLYAFISGVSGVKLSKTAEEKRRSDIFQNIYSLKGRQEELYQYLGKIKDPHKEIENYNKTVMGVLNNPLVKKDMTKKEWIEEMDNLIIDEKRLLSNKIYRLTNPNLDVEEGKKIIKTLKNFGITDRQAKAYLAYYWEQHPTKHPGDAKHLLNKSLRRARLEERYRAAAID